MLIHLVPEIILLLAVILILSLQSWANNYYNSNFFKLLLVNSFGQKKVDFLESQSHSTRIIGARLGQLKQLYVLSFSWNIAFFACFLAGLWSLFNSADTVHNFHLESLLNENQFSFIGLNDVLFGNHFYYDSFVFYSRFFILLVSLIFLLLFKNETFLDVKLQKIEFLVLILLGIIFSLLMVAASSFLSLFLIIEGLVMIMYILSAGGSLTSLYPISKIIRFRSVEGSLKYVITNAIAGSLFLLGSFLVILFSNGEIYFINLNMLLSLDNPLGSLSLYSQFGILCGFILISSTFLFKIGAIPFHAWMADLYESSTLGVLSFFVLIPKMAILLTFINLYRFLFIHFPFIFFLFFVCVGLCSLVFGAILASKQVKISRLIAYSSVSQVGALLILLSLVGLNPNIPYALVMLFVISYAFVMLHFMSVLSSIKGSPALSSITLLKELPFVKSLSPFAQTVVSIFIFNLSGLPPFLGWVLKSSVLFSVLLLAFDSFSYFDSTSTFSSFELNTLYVFNNFFNSSFNNANFFSSIIFLMLLFFAIIIFMSLVVSVHYSIQLYKVSFSEISNVSSSYSASTFSFSSTLLIGSLLFIVTVINFLAFFGIVSIFSWLQFVCFAF
jgi:NADH-quinone oxidoreductase subunit N